MKYLVVFMTVVHTYFYKYLHFLPAIDYLLFSPHDSVDNGTTCIFSVDTNFFTIYIKDLLFWNRALLIYLYNKNQQRVPSTSCHRPEGLYGYMKGIP